MTANGEHHNLTFLWPWKVLAVVLAVGSHEHIDQNSLPLLRHPLDFHPRILYLTGTQEQLAKVTKGYRVYFSKVRECPSYR